MTGSAMPTTSNRRFRPAARLLLALALAAPVAGCGGATAQLSGTVVYDGKAVENGYITFYPANGKGFTKGAEVQAGRYTLVGLPPGRYKAVVAARPEAVVEAAADGT